MRSNGKRKMKRSMIWTTTIREIKGSLGRFLAIFAIVALGVGLFSGLKITKTDFIHAMTDYYDENSFYDYRIMGELGFSERQVETFRNQKDVMAAEGAISYDAYFREDDGAQAVGKFHSITKDVNKTVLFAGRMPQNPGECLGDALRYGKHDVGRVITLDEENTDETLENFSQKSFEIVGIVRSPLYVQFERGNTALGTGSIDAFVYIPKEAFASDTYTEVYVKFAKNFVIYSDDYKDFMKEKEKQWKTIADNAGHDRFLELPELISDAREKLDEKRREAQKKLDEAKKELDAAASELEDAEKQIRDGKEELEKGWNDLAKAREDLDDAKKLMEEKEPELEKGLEELEKAKKKIEENEKLIAEKETELSQGKKQLEAAELTVKLGEMQCKLTMENLISEQKTIDTSRKSLEDREKSLNEREALLASLGLWEQYAETIAKERDEIAKEKTALDSQEADLNRRYRETLELNDQVVSGRKELEENKAKVEAGEKELQKGKEALRKGKKELVDAEKTLEKGKSELREGKKKIQDGEKEITDGENLLKEKEAELSEGEQKYLDGKKEYEDGLITYQDAVVEFEEKIGDAENAIKKFEDRLENGEEPASYLLGRGTNLGYVCFESDSAIVDGIANVFPVFFFLVAALICMTTMNRMVEEQRTQIGVLKALGYSDGRIMFKFIFYSGFAATTGALIGYYAGTRVFPFFIWTVYGIIYQAGSLRFVFDPMLAAISLAVSLLCSVGTTYLSCRKELGSHAATLMRPRAPKSGKRVFLEYVPFLWKRLSFLRKVAVRNVLRYKKRFFMMVLGIGGCTGLLLTGFGLKDSIVGVAEMQYTEIQLNDLAVTLQKEIDDEFLGKLEKLREKGLGKYLIYQENSLEMVGKNAQKSLTVITFPKETTQEELSEFLRLRTTDGQYVTKPGKGEVVITNAIAELLGIKAGDEIAMVDPDQKEMKVKVSAIANNYIFNYAFLDQETWEDAYDAPYSAKSMFIKVAEGRDVKELAPRVVRLDGVGNVTVTTDLLKRFNAMMESMNLIVILVTSCAAGLAFIVLFNLTNINVTERIREIATIKVLGFYPSETALYVFRENFVLTAIGSCVGLGMGIWLHSFVMHEIKVEMVRFGVRILPASYVYAVILTLLFSVIVSLIMNKKLDEISMTESLKSVD